MHETTCEKYIGIIWDDLPPNNSHHDDLITMIVSKGSPLTFICHCYWEMGSIPRSHHVISHNRLSHAPSHWQYTPLQFWNPMTPVDSSTKSIWELVPTSFSQNNIYKTYIYKTQRFGPLHFGGSPAKPIDPTLSTADLLFTWPDDPHHDVARHAGYNIK